MSHFSDMPLLRCQQSLVDILHIVTSVRCAGSGFVTTLVFLLAACGKPATDAADSVTLTEKPLQSVSVVDAKPETSHFSVRIRIPDEDLLAVLEKNIPQSRKDDGRNNSH